MPRPKPRLLIRAGEASQKVEVRYLAGDEQAAFDLVRRSLPALQELARATRAVVPVAEAGG